MVVKLFRKKERTPTERGFFLNGRAGKERLAEANDVSILALDEHRVLFAVQHVLNFHVAVNLGYSDPSYWKLKLFTHIDIVDGGELHLSRKVDNRGMSGILDA